MQNLKIVLTIALSINLAFSNLFFSEAAEGSSNNKYLEVFNASDADIDLTNYAFPSVSNDPTEVGVYEYWNAFSEGATVAAGDVYVICHPSADDLIQTECDETFTYLSNGDDGFCLVNGNENEYSIVDCVGDWNADPGSGWDVCGISDATKDHTIVRKSSVSVGNSGDWTASAGTNTDDCEWLVFEQNDWTNLGSHSFDANNEPDHIVYVGPYMTYTPQDLSIETGETVQWIMEGGFHDVNGVTNTITGESFNNPEEFYFDATSDLGVMGEFTFTIPGLYNYDCSVGNHAAMGMIGSINVAQGAILGCMDPNATNYNSDATEQDYDGNGTSSCTYDSCEDIPTETGCLWDTGQSAEWWEGWWNCTENGGQVCGLAEVIFEVDLPDGVEGVPHVQGTYNGWCGSCFNDMTDEDGDGIWSHTQYFSAGEYHDYKYSIGAWVEQEDLTGLDCAAEADGFWNRNFTAGEANTSQTLAHCYGSCETTCGDTPPPPTSYDVTFDLDGIDDCGFVSVTGSWDGWSGWGATPDNNYTISLQDGSYEYVILCVNTEGEWWNDIWSNSTFFNAPLECDVTVDVEDGPFGNYGLTVAGENQTVSLCAGTCDETCGSGVVCGTGDSNQDSGVDVLDVVLVVDFVLGNNTPNDDQLCASDMNADGGIDVLDVVQIVDIILGNRGFKANTAEILINGSDVKFDANRIVDAFQIKLSHNGPIELELTDDALVSKYRTVGNTTTLIIVSPESDYLFTSDNHYIIEEALAATTDGYIDVTMDIPLDYTIGNAYPNPFNPTTNLSIDLNTNAKVNISIYNTMGQLMDVIVNDNLSSGYHTYVWDANDAPSGLYLIQTDVNSNISTQKVLLIK